MTPTTRTLADRIDRIEALAATCEMRALRAYGRYVATLAQVDAEARLGGCTRALWRRATAEARQWLALERRVTRLLAGLRAAREAARAAESHQEARTISATTPLGDRLARVYHATYASGRDGYLVRFTRDAESRVDGIDLRQVAAYRDGIAVEDGAP